MNNFEKIKNMTIDEMAKLIICIVTSKCLVNDCVNCMFKCLFDNAQEPIKQWLQQEVSE